MAVGQSRMDGLNCEVLFKVRINLTARDKGTENQRYKGTDGVNGMSAK